MSKKKILVYIGSPLLSLVVLTATAFAINSITEGYRVGATKTTITAQGVCKGVTCTGGQDIFVPTNSANEWNLFLANKPSYVTLGECVTVPGAPQNLTGTEALWREQGQTHANDPLIIEITINWDAPLNDGGSITGYNIYRSTALNGVYSKINTSIVAATSYMDKSPMFGTTYYYKVSAVNSAGEGPQSSAISVKTRTIIVNSASNQTCTQKCNALSLGCLSIGTDAVATNGNQFRNNGYGKCENIHAYYKFPSEPPECDKPMQTDYTPISCSGHQTKWTYCACK